MKVNATLLIVFCVPNFRRYFEVISRRVIVTYLLEFAQFLCLQLTLSYAFRWKQSNLQHVVLFLYFRSLAVCNEKIEAVFIIFYNIDLFRHIFRYSFNYGNVHFVAFDTETDYEVPFEEFLF